VVGDLIIEAGGFDGVDGVHRDRVLDAGHTEALAVAADDDLIGNARDVDDALVTRDGLAFVDARDAEVATRRG
jgi:hypothetical protein